MRIFFEKLSEEPKEIINDKLIMEEVLVEITKTEFEKNKSNQEYMTDKYQELKTEDAKEMLKKIIDEGFVHLCMVETALKEARKSYEQLKKQAKEIL